MSGSLGKVDQRMDEQPLAVVLGDSLLIEGVAMSLEDDGQRLRIVRVDTALPDFKERVKSLNPKLVIFELDNPRSPTMVLLLREQPGALFLGLDPDCNQVVVLNSSQHLARSMTELGQLLQIQMNSRV
jgi:hypothetical protein